MSDQYRPRRMRQGDASRRLLRETHLSVDQLVMPLFVRSGKGVRAPIPSMPGQFQWSVDQLVKECQEIAQRGIPAVLLFGVSEQKDARASAAYAADGVVQQAIRAIKAKVPTLFVITDVCLCAYTTHGHCGVVTTRATPQGRAHPSRHESSFVVENDASVELLAKVAVSHAIAGADMVAPSDMMDGNVAGIRRALDAAKCTSLPIMAYTVKYASAFYGPFREAAGSAPAFGDRRSYQMDPANAEEALREAQLDIKLGADVLMVKPALAYLDIVRRLKDAFHYPVAAFNVSGEYAMVKAAAARGWIDERAAWMEMLLAMKRAGADLLITYWARDAATLLRAP